MKASNFFFMTILLLSSNIAAQDALTDYDYALKADTFFREGKFKEALDGYRELKNPTANAFSNMGSCHFQLEDYGNALWRWRQAEKRWGFWGRGDLAHNLNIVQQKLNLTSGKKVLLGQRIHDSLQKGCRSIPLVFMQIIFLFFWAFLFLNVKKLIKQRCKKTLLVLFFFIFACGGVLVYHHILLSHVYAVVTEASSDIYSGPSTTYQKIGVLKKGDEVRVDVQERDFYKVSTYTWSGWTTRSNLGII